MYDPLTLCVITGLLCVAPNLSQCGQMISLCKEIRPLPIKKHQTQTQICDFLSTDADTDL